MSVTHPRPAAPGAAARRANRRRGTLAVYALVALTVLGMSAACSKSKNSDKPGTVHLVVDTFGDFGYDDLIKQYETDHKGITIELRKTAQLNDYRPKLVRYLATNKGAGDVVGLEEGILNEFKLNTNNWVDLKPLVGDKSGQYLDWKYQAGFTADGKLMGLPTDVGGLAVCYRRDLFQAAGMPVDREAVSALWPTWEKFIEAGQAYKSKTGKAMLDSVTTAFSAKLFQGGDPLFYDKDDNVVADTSPSVRAAFDLSTSLADAGITAKAKTWSAEWNAGFKNGTFAVTFCPSWMQGIVKANSGDENSGKWDVATVPGGAGNWGGSWLAVPTQSKHQAEAAKLAEFLTSAKSQVAAFKKAGPLPTNKTALADPDFVNFTNPYFNNAPVGKIFGAGAVAIKPVYLGPKFQAIKEQAFEPALQAYEAGQLSKDAAWTQATTDAKAKGAL
jgi:cellobiose transport system substrate-binding protein